MSNSQDKFTPGPWVVEKLRSTGYHKHFTNFIYWLKARKIMFVFLNLHIQAKALSSGKTKNLLSSASGWIWLMQK